MGVFKELLDTLLNKPVDPRQNVDWDVYNEDLFNGMPWEEREKKILAGGYEKGKAKPSSNHGRIDDVEKYNLDAKYMGENYAEIMRRNGMYVKQDRNEAAE